MAAVAPDERSLRLTWLEVGERVYYLIARCETCGLVVERQVNDVDDDERVLEAIATELLEVAGCEHVHHAVGSGMRPALRR